METFYMPTEHEYKRWVKEAVHEYMQENFPIPKNSSNEECLLNRKEIARFLRVSLVTPTDWMKRGYLPTGKEGVFT